MNAWKLSDAKIQLSKIVKLVKTDGPQTITFKGVPDCVIISYEEYLNVREYLKNDKI